MTAEAKVDYMQQALTLADIYHDVKIKMLVEARALRVDDACKIIPDPAVARQIAEENPGLAERERLRLARARTFIKALEAYNRSV